MLTYETLILERVMQDTKLRDVLNFIENEKLTDKELVRLYKFFLISVIRKILEIEYIEDDREYDRWTQALLDQLDEILRNDPEELFEKADQLVTQSAMRIPQVVSKE